MRSRWAFFVGLLLFVSAPFALAQSEGEPSSYDLDEARRLFEEAKAHYNLFDYEKALESFKRAYLLSKEPGLLVNIGQCYRYLNRQEEAIKTWKLFLLEVPDGPLTPSVTRLIMELETSPESLPASKEPLMTETVVTEPESEPSSAPAVTPPETLPSAPPETKERGPSRLFYTGAAITGGVGLAFGGIAALVAFQARGEEKDLNPGGAQQIRERAKALGLVADLSLGAALLSGGVGFLLSRRAPKKDYSVSLAPRGVSVRIRFY